MINETKRDLLADLAICERATPGPWWQKSYQQPEPPVEGARELSTLLYYSPDEGEPRFWDWENDGTFVAEAREGWPHAIRRALEAEKRVEELEAEVESLRNKLDRLNDILPCDVDEVLGDE